MNSDQDDHADDDENDKNWKRTNHSLKPKINNYWWWWSSCNSAISFCVEHVALSHGNDRNSNSNHPLEHWEHPADLPGRRACPPSLWAHWSCRQRHCVAPLNYSTFDCRWIEDHSSSRKTQRYLQQTKDEDEAKISNDKENTKTKKRFKYQEDWLIDQLDEKNLERTERTLSFFLSIKLKIQQLHLKSLSLSSKGNQFVPSKESGH